MKSRHSKALLARAMTLDTEETSAAPADSKLTQDIKSAPTAMCVVSVDVMDRVSNLAYRRLKGSEAKEFS